MTNTHKQSGVTTDEHKQTTMIVTTINAMDDRELPRTPNLGTRPYLGARPGNDKPYLGPASSGETKSPTDKGDRKPGGA